MIASNSSINAKVRNFLVETLDQNQIEDLARSSGFIQKRKKISGVLFALFLLCESRQAKPASLAELSAKFGLRGISISKQGIDNRFNEAAAQFMKQLTDRALTVKLDRHEVTDVAVRFNRIMIKDSTIFQLPETCASKYPGHGGGASSAGIKIQYEYDLKAKAGLLFQTQPSRTPDNVNCLKNIQPMDLCLEDLGYITHHHLEEIINQGAYFLCRLNYCSSVFIKKGEHYYPININRIAANMKIGQMLETSVYLGRQNKIPVRVILERVPNEVAEEKRRKLKTDKQNKRKGLSSGRLAFCDVNAYVTNALDDLLPGRLIRSIYSLRWQVEIIFKTWKSTFNLDKVTPMKLPRFECLNYGTLLQIIICTKLFDYYKTIMWNTSHLELSEMKAMNFLKIFTIQIITQWISQPSQNIDKLLLILKEILRNRCVKERKRGRRTPMMILDQLPLT